MYIIKFGTDGWREIIAKDYTVENVKRVATATAQWILSSSPENSSCTVGYDCRFGGKMFAEETARVLAEKGIKVFLSNGFCSTPMISLANVKLKTFAGIIITASHNPPTYNGYKIKASYGGPAIPSEVDKVEKLIDYSELLETENLDFYIENNLIEYANFEDIYVKEIQEKFDVNKLQSYGKYFGYDAMYGAGQNVVKRILPDAFLMHCSNNPGFEGVAPEPILKNLLPFSEHIAKNTQIKCGLATDGDADRIGFFNSKGKFVDSHHLILLLMKYLKEFKGLSGKIVKSFSVSSKIDKLAKIMNLETETTKIGFKYICEKMINEDVLIGAEESGGIAVKGHIPERDGVWMGLLILEYMAVTQKTIEELIQEVYDLVGSFAVERYDLHLTEVKKQEVISICKQGTLTNFGEYQIEKVEDLDGFKFYLNNEQWVMIRPSGTEPVLRVYAEALNSENAFKILDTVKKLLID